MYIFVYLVLFFVGIFFLAIVFRWAKESFQRGNRRYDNKDDFIGYFVRKGISESLALSVYDSLQSGCYHKDFPVRREDNIAEVYGIVDDDLDDLVKEIAEANDLELPLNTDYWKTPVVTVEDLIEFIDSFPPRP